PQPAGRRRRGAPDAEPRLRHRRALPLRRHPVREDASADDRGPRRTREHVASLHDILRRVRPGLARVAGPQRLRRRVPRAPWDVRILGRAPARWALLGTAGRDRRHPRRGLPPLDVPARDVWPGARSVSGAARPLAPRGGLRGPAPSAHRDPRSVPPALHRAHRAVAPPGHPSCDGPVVRSRGIQVTGADLTAVAPEIVVTAVAMIVLIADAMLDRRRAAFALPIITIAG